MKPLIAGIMSIVFVVVATASLLQPVCFAAEGERPRDANAGNLKMALVSMKSVYSDGPDYKANRARIDANLKRHLYFVDKLADDGAEFIGFPEMSLSGYHFGDKLPWLPIDCVPVEALRKKAADKGVYISFGMALVDADGKHRNAQIVVDPQGKIIGAHYKISLTKEKGFAEPGTGHTVVEVKGTKMGIATCADGSYRENLQALVDGGARIIFAPHCNTTGGTTDGWYKFRSAWAGPTGWMAELKVYGALVNNAGLFNPDLNPPSLKDANSGWAGGAWFIGPGGETLAQLLASRDKNDSKENVVIFNVPIR
jgi:NAD+ synthase (glutamine-hydrolysing)